MAEDQERGDRLPAIIEYMRSDLAAREREQGVIHFHYHEAPRPEPAAPPPVDVATKYAPHLVLATWSMIVLAGVAVVFVMIASALMTIMISLAVCSLAVAAAVRSLRYSKHDASRHK